MHATTWKSWVPPPPTHSLPWTWWQWWDNWLLLAAKRSKICDMIKDELDVRNVDFELSYLRTELPNSCLTLFSTSKYCSFIPKTSSIEIGVWITIHIEKSLCHMIYFHDRHDYSQFTMNAPLMCPPFSTFRKFRVFTFFLAKLSAFKMQNFLVFALKSPHFARNRVLSRPYFWKPGRHITTKI